ncbi:purine permease 1-like [Wolffia australiana]
MVSSQEHGGNTKQALLAINCTLIVAGASAPLLLRLYFLNGGDLLWLSSLVQVGGWPLLLIPITISTLSGDSSTSISLPLFAAASGIGLLIGLDSYLFAVSSSALPATTNAILNTTQLAFVAVFSFLIVRQKFTPFSVNAVVVLTLGAVVLAAPAAADRPAGETKGKYFLGFAASLGSAALYALTLPLTELVFRRVRGPVTHRMVLEVQVVVSAFASVVCVVGMLVKGDFQEVARESGEPDIGKVKYYLVLVGGAVAWQAFSLGLMGTIACSSSLFAGVVVAVLLPVSEVTAVVLFRERFDVRKGVAMALSLWGFASYCYGDLSQPRPFLRRSTLLELPSP